MKTHFVAALVVIGGLIATAPHAARPVLEARSDDGQWRLAAQGDAPASLVLADREGAPVRSYVGQRRDGRDRGRAVAVFHVPGRRSFVVAFTPLRELWEISLDPQAPPIFDGLVHDYRMGEAIAEPGFLGVRRAPLPMSAVAARPGRQPAHVWLQFVPDADGRHPVCLLHLDVRRCIAHARLDGRPDLAAATWDESTSPPRLRVPDTMAADGAQLLEWQAPALRVVKP